MPELPEDRVRAFVDNWDVPGDELDMISQYTDAEGRLQSLSVSDLRDVLSELSAHRQTLETKHTLQTMIDGFDPHDVKGVIR